MPNRVVHEVVDLANLWRQCCSGGWEVVDHGCTSQAFTLVVKARVARTEPAEGRAFDILRDLLLGTHPMAVAIKHSMSPSTVTLLHTRALRTIGISTRKVRPAPVILAVAAHAVESKTVLTKATGVTTTRGDSARLRVNIERFDQRLLPRTARWPSVTDGGNLLPGQELTPAEADVVRLRVQGLEFRQIASSRATAAGTVTHLWRRGITKLGVRTRAELLSKLIRAAT